MIDLLQRAVDLALAHPGWAAPAFGLLAFGESLVLAGTIIPATPMLFLVGTLVGSGRLDPVAVVGWAVAGAIAGYWLSWVIGRRLGHRVYQARLLAGHRRGIARTRLFFRRWGGPSLILGRFLLGPFQSTLPLVAGVAKMGARRFHGWNVASSILWVIVVLTPGWCAAKGLTLFGFGDAQQRMLVGALLAVSGGAVLLTIGAGLWRLVGRRRGPDIGA